MYRCEPCSKGNRYPIRKNWNPCCGDNEIKHEGTQLRAELPREKITRTYLAKTAAGISEFVWYTH